VRDGKSAGQDTELLGASDVAKLVGVKETTVWRWCREGRLPCLKVGKLWRVRQGALEAFLKDNERAVTLVAQLDSYLQVPDNVLAVAQNVGVLHRLDAAFFRVGQARGGLLVKFYAGESYQEEELLADFERNGLEARWLKREGQLLMRPEAEPVGEGRGEQLERLVEEAGEGSTIWASFDWVRPVDLETTLKQQEQLTELVGEDRLVIKTAALEEAIDRWPLQLLRRTQSTYPALILASEEELSLSRATPMPRS
jgi:excisionase family DNA binding protein